MKRVVNFTRIRFIMFAVSAVLIIAGFAGTVLQGGFNLGIDFQSGISQRVQIAPICMEVSYTGETDTRFNILDSAVRIDSYSKDGKKVEHLFKLEDYNSAADLAQAVSGVESVYVDLKDGSVSPSSILSMAFAIDLNEEKAVVNYSNEGSSEWISIDEVRAALEGAGDPQIQVVGSEDKQEFLIRLEDNGTDKDFSRNASEKVLASLETAFGKGSVIVKKSDYVGPRFSAELGSQVFFLVILALLLILMYIWFRFELAFAVSAIIALVHDVAMMLGFIGLTQMEVVTATIAAVLTIVGYSLNDTIVVFDRIRENRTLMRDSDTETIINTSITQSLSRTLITSVTTLLAVAAIYVFASGQIKDFALAMIFGVVVGTYSSIFIASPVLLGWINARRKNKLAKDKKKYGARPEIKKAAETAFEKKDADVSVDIPVVERKKKGKRQQKK